MPADTEPFDTGLRSEDLDTRRPRPLDTPWGPMSILACERGLVAVQSFCPHLMGPLFQGSVAGETVTCPWHQWRFSLRTGERLDREDAGAALLLCDVARGPRGTLVLSRPRRIAAPAPRVP